MINTYEDADPDEIVTASGDGDGSLRTFLIRFKKDRAAGRNMMITLHRDLGKNPSFFTDSDLDELSRLPAFRDL